MIGIRAALILGMALGLMGCQTISFYSQSVVGHTRLMMARQPVSEVLDVVDPEIAVQLRLAEQVKVFAVKELALPNNKSYTSYVALEREYPVWVVVAAEPFSLRAKEWCYLVIGCAAYRGFFKQSAADMFADKLQASGYETDVSGASAYSTLGWFSDPLLPSMLRHGDTYTIETIIHELAHQRLYINGRSSLNEAFATLVAEEGTRRWLMRFKPNAVDDYEVAIQARGEFHSLVQSLKTRLTSLYEQATVEESQAGLSDEPLKELAQAKAHLISEFRSEYEGVKAKKWDGKAYYGGWVSEPINNARLAGFSTYREYVPKLRTLFEQCGADFERFYHTLESFGKSRRDPSSSVGNAEPAMPNTCM